MQRYKQLLVTCLCVCLLSTNVLYAAAKPITATDSAEQAERASQQQELTNYFFAAARIGQTEVLREFLQAGFPVNVRNAQSYTALMTATYYGQKEFAAMFGQSEKLEALKQELQPPRS